MKSEHKVLLQPINGDHTQDTVTIFIPVPVKVAEIHFYSDMQIPNPKSITSTIFNLQGLRRKNENNDQEFADHFDFTSLTQVLNNRSNNCAMQIGKNDTEAAEIDRLYSHADSTIIVEAKVPVTSLSDNRFIQKELESKGVLIAIDRNYAWLNKCHAFKLEDIVSVKTLPGNYVHDEIPTSIQKKITMNDIWPEGKTLVNKDTDLTNQSFSPENILIPTQSYDQRNQKIFNQLRKKFATFVDENILLKESGNDILKTLDEEAKKTANLPDLIQHLQKLNAATEKTDKIKDLLTHAETKVQGHPEFMAKLCGFAICLIGIFMLTLGCLAVIAPPTIGTGVFFISMGAIVTGCGATMFASGFQHGLSKKIDTFANGLEKQKSKVC